MTNDTRPILAVDVDGVLNSLSLTRLPPSGWRDAKATDSLGVEYPIRYNPAHGPALLAVAEQAGAELVWLTTWQERANEAIAPLVGLPALPVIPLPREWRGSPRSVGVIKAAALIRYAGNRPAVWLEDETDAPEALSSWQTPHLVVPVNWRTGLQCRDLAQARTWLEGDRDARLRAELDARFTVPEHAAKDDSGDWLECPCGNTPLYDGFYSCTTAGTVVEPEPEVWDGLLFVCPSCGRIINDDTLAVTGRRTDLAALAAECDLTP